VLLHFLKAKAGLFNPAEPGKVVEVEVLVDTGTIYSVVERDLLQQLGVKLIGGGLGSLESTWRGMQAR
jgi:hypothetical protein